MSDIEIPKVKLPDPEEAQDGFSRLVAIAVVTTTVAAALVGLLYSYASKKGDGATTRAQELAVVISAKLGSAEREAEKTHDLVGLSREQRTRQGNAIQSILRGGPGQDRARLEAERLATLGDRTDQLSGHRLNDPAGPDLDPTFTDRFFIGASREANRLWALQDAANKESDGWGRQASTYVKVLTMFAVALYLLGLSLSLKTGPRWLLVGVGLTLAGVGVAVAGAGAATPPHRASPEAADDFAAGRDALWRATSPADLVEARDRYTKAIGKRSDFTQAYVERAEAVFRLGSPQAFESQLGKSLTTTRALAAANSDLLTARRQGDRKVLGDLGFNLYVQSLDRHDRRLLDRSIAFTRQAIALDPDGAFPRYNLGVALLAAGKDHDARRAYRQALDRTVYTDPATKKRRGDYDAFLQDQYVSAALTDLELLQEARPELTGKVTATKEMIVAGVALRNGEPQQTNVRANNVVVTVTPGRLTWQARLEGFDSERDVLSVEWYHQDLQERGWSALPEVSQTYLDQQPLAQKDGTSLLPSPYLTAGSPPRCVPPGRYRVELYVNGRRVSRDEGRYFPEPLTGVIARDVNVGLCYPPDWQRAERSLPGSVQGFVSPDGTRGLYVVQFHRSRTGENPAEISARELRSMVDRLGEPPLSVLPSKPVLEVLAGGPDFLSLAGPVQAQARYQGGALAALAGVDTNGEVKMAFVFGPPDYFEGLPPEPLTLIRSLITP